MSESLSRLFSSVSGLLATRFQLLGIELQEELERIIQLFLLVAAAAVFACMFLLMATVLLLIVFWDDYRVVVTLGLLLVYGVLAALCLFSLRRRLQQGHTPFATVAGEFVKDQHMLFGTRQPAPPAEGGEA